MHMKRPSREKIDATDDASLVELLNIRPAIVEGSFENIKITTPDDLDFAERFGCVDSEIKDRASCAEIPMAVKKILLLGNPVLRSKCKPVKNLLPQKQHGQ